MVSGAILLWRGVCTLNHARIVADPLPSMPSLPSIDTVPSSLAGGAGGRSVVTATTALSGTPSYYKYSPSRRRPPRLQGMGSSHTALPAIRSQSQHGQSPDGQRTTNSRGQAVWSAAFADDAALPHSPIQSSKHISAASRLGSGGFVGRSSSASAAALLSPIKATTKFSPKGSAICSVAGGSGNVR